MNNAAKRHPTTKPALQIYHMYFRHHPSSQLPILSQRSLKEADFSSTFMGDIFGSRSDFKPALTRKLFVKTEDSISATNIYHEMFFV
jgi:hypothetical protein